MDAFENFANVDIWEKLLSLFVCLFVCFFTTKNYPGKRLSSLNTFSSGLS